MSAKEMAMHMWPCWLIGILMLYAVWNSKYKNMLRVTPRAIVKFLLFMVFITICRVVAFRMLAPPEAIEQIKGIIHFLPWQTTLGVFWEDAAHSLPLVLMGKIFKKSKWYSYVSLPLLAMVMFSFGSGHMYQGLIASIAISFYVPFSMKMGEKHGFGTVMICHILYDMITLLSLGWMVGM
jgi:hypothetical protein